MVRLRECKSNLKIIFAKPEPRFYPADNSSKAEICAMGWNQICRTIVPLNLLNVISGHGKYSEMLREFVSPYLDKFEELMERKDQLYKMHKVIFAGVELTDNGD
jgi:hypothetical protein